MLSKVNNDADNIIDNDVNNNVDDVNVSSTPSSTSRMMSTFTLASQCTGIEGAVYTAWGSTPS